MAAPPSPNLAYLTVVEDGQAGWTGGLLVLNKGGRPLEFHCTLPLRPSRTHEILFGATLRQHVIGEVIGPLLLEKCRSPVSILCCDQLESLSLSARLDYPTVLVREAWERAASTAPQDQSSTGELLKPAMSDVSDDDSQQPSRAKTAISERKTVLLAGSRLLVQETQFERVRDVVRQLVDLPDAVEPFERIREAIHEAQSQVVRGVTPSRQAG
jgi:hypothetical protein